MKSKRRLAAEIMKTSPTHVRFDSTALDDIQKAITRSDFRGLIAVGKIAYDHAPGQSRGRARQIQRQKRKGRRRGRGSHKGAKQALVERKRKWINTIRAQRSYLQELTQRDQLSGRNYRLLYARSKGGYFRSLRHLKLYLTEHQLLEKSKGDKLNEQLKNEELKEGSEKS
ncbi:MAG: 50S ribosomal protein L19e [Nanoarchaeota archaeon]